MELGIDSFVSTPLDPSKRGPNTDADRVQDVLEEIELADQVGLDVFGIGEHHRPEYIASSPAMILAAAAARTNRIRLSSAVTVLSSDDPVRVFQQFATLDLISRGRAEIIVGRGSFIESYPLFGFDLKDYDELFSEKLDLLLKIRDNVNVNWLGNHRAPLTGQGVYPRPHQAKLPIKLGVGGTPNSFVRAGVLGLPLVVAIIGGRPASFRHLVELYREAGRQSGHDPKDLTVSVHSLGYLADTMEEAVADYYPGYVENFTRIGKERGWGPITRSQFDDGISPHGALMVGSPEDIAKKILHIEKSLGDISQVTIHLDGGAVPHAKALHAIELLGTRVAPFVNEELAAVAV